MGAEERYGPSGKLVEEYIEQVSEAFKFDNRGEPDPNDGSVVRVGSLKEAAEVTDCELLVEADGESYFLECPGEDTALVRFLLLVDRVDTENTRVAEQAGLDREIERAVNDACDQYLWGEEDFLGHELQWPEGFGHECEFSVQAHCEYIATELVVAHLTKIHLLRDMWYWYRGGHWPCGWKGEWPDGRLIVY